MTPKVTPPGHIKCPDLKLPFSKFDIVPKAHQWSELFETRSVLTYISGKIALPG